MLANRMDDITLDEIDKYFNECGQGIDFEKILSGNTEVNNHKLTHNSGIKCISCGNDSIVEDYSQGIAVCNKCGQVQDNLLDYNPEWKQFEDEDKAQGRCGAIINPRLPQSSIGTSIAGRGRCRIKTLHSWNTMPYKERSLYVEFKKIKEICTKLKITKCVSDDAEIMYKMTSECKHTSGKNKGKFVITRGINRIGISAASIFFACIRNKVTRTSKEIANAYSIRDLDMNRGCKSLLKLLKQRKINIQIGTSKPEHFVKRYCDELKIKNIFAQEAIKISQNLDKLNIASDHTPYSLAAASILLMSQINNIKHITKKKLADEFCISEVTITKTYKEIEPYKHVLTDSDATIEIVNNVNSQLKNEEVSQEILDRMKQFGVIPDDPPSNKHFYNVGDLERLKNITKKSLKNINENFAKINNLIRT